MIFKRQLIAKIMDPDPRARKTQTRRLIQGDQPCKYRVGRTYAIQAGRGKPAIARIRILDVRTERLGEITLEDARREGFKATFQFFQYWEQLHGSVNKEQLVWVIGFALEPEQPIFLARPTRTSGDYTENVERAIDDIEAVRAGDLERLSTNDAQLRIFLREHFEGQEPDEALAAWRMFGTTAWIQQARRSMGLRAIDGLPRPSEDEMERIERFVLEKAAVGERSVREVARALDCSVGHAHALIAAHRQAA
jgi:hypothetical protein